VPTPVCVPTSRRSTPAAEVRVTAVHPGVMFAPLIPGPGRGSLPLFRPMSDRSNERHNTRRQRPPGGYRVARNHQRQRGGRLSKTRISQPTAMR
jgi:hypothetical protein